MLVVHNRYRSGLPSGENRVVDDEVRMLREAGVAVDTLLADSDDIADFSPVQRAGLAVRPIVSPESVRTVRARIAACRPDVLHLHNPYPLVSPWVVRAAHQEGVPVVQTVHNYRHICAAATFFRDGHVCEDCRGRAFPWPAVAHACYRGSRAQSLVMASALAVHRPTWRTVDRFLPVSAFVGQYLLDLGIPPDRIVVKPNAVPDPGPPPPLGTDFVFAGRLDPEKGPLHLLDAWEASGLGSTNQRLIVAGDGPLRNAIVERVAHLDGVEYVGAVPSEDMPKLLARARAVVIPSLCYEGFPVLAAEALAHGRPVVAHDLGALASIVDDEVGWLAAPTIPALAEALQKAASESSEKRATAARRRFVDRYTQERVCRLLLDVYEAVSR